MLPKYPHQFIYWWLITTPKYLFTLVKRFIVLINSKISFTLNLSLLFTPLFGDYTVIGRFIGFVTRLFEIVFGIIIVGTLTVVAITLPITWWISPIWIFIEYKFWLVPVLICEYLMWHIASSETPSKRIAQTTIDNYESASRPLTLTYLKELTKDRQKGIKKIGDSKNIKELLKTTELDKTDLIQKLATIPSLDITKLPEKSLEIANLSKARYLEPECVFLAFLSLIPNADSLLATYGITLSLVTKTTLWIIQEREMLDKLFIWQPDYEMVFTGGTGKGMTGRVTPFLDSMSADYTKEAISGGYKRYTVREKEIKKIAELLSGSNENLLIVGDPGCGKTSIIKGIAYKIMEGTSYSALNNKRIVSMELSGIVSGTKGIGEISEKIKYAIREAKGSGDIILFIDEIHTLIAGGSNSPEISAIYSILEPELAGGKIKFIGATTIQNYRKYIEPNGAFARLFNILEVEEASKEETLEILKYDVREYQSKKNIFITYPAL